MRLIGSGITWNEIVQSKADEEKMFPRRGGLPRPSSSSYLSQLSRLSQSPRASPSESPEHSADILSMSLQNSAFKAQASLSSHESVQVALLPQQEVILDLLTENKQCRDIADGYIMRGMSTSWG